MEGIKGKGEWCNHILTKCTKIKLNIKSKVIFFKLNSIKWKEKMKKELKRTKQKGRQKENLHFLNLGRLAECVRIIGETSSPSHCLR